MQATAGELTRRKNQTNGSPSYEGEITFLQNNNNKISQ